MAEQQNSSQQKQGGRKPAQDLNQVLKVRSLSLRNTIRPATAGKSWNILRRWTAGKFPLQAAS